jgi:hypothetical protein
MTSKKNFVGIAVAIAFTLAGAIALPFVVQAATYTPSYSSTYTPSSSSGSGSTYTPSYSTTYTPSSSSGSGSTYTPSYSTTYSPSSSSGSKTYTPSYSTTYTPSSGSSGVTHYDTGCCKTTTKTYTPSYSTTYTPTYTTPTYTTYTYTSGGGGGSYTPPKKPAPTCTLTVSKSSITQGEGVVVTWNSQNAVHGNVSHIGTNVPLSYSLTVYPTQTTTYTGTFHNGQGKSVTCSATVSVVPPQCPAGYTGTYPHCVPPVVHPAPVCSIVINNYNNSGYYAANQPVTISWTSQNAQYGYINQGLGSVSLSGSRVVYPTQTTTYTGTFYGHNGQTVTCSVTININNYVPPVYPTTPYVTLSAVPYTGLELGPVGTVLYWAFIVAWCLLAAYLLAVKRVQNSVYASLKDLLFGSKTTTHAMASHAGHVSYTTPVVRNEDKTDDFILSQINRIRG